MWALVEVGSEEREWRAKVFVLLPQTFMNLSGEALVLAARQLGVAPREIVIVHDDMDLEPGRVKVKVGGGDGGHRGVASCIQLLGSPDFVRVRIGIGRDKQIDGIDYVLSKIHQEHKESLRTAVTAAVEAVETIVTKGVARAMNIFNRRRPSPAKEGVAGENEGEKSTGR